MPAEHGLKIAQQPYLKSNSIIGSGLQRLLIEPIGSLLVALSSLKSSPGTQVHVIAWGQLCCLLKKAASLLRKAQPSFQRCPCLYNDTHMFQVMNEPPKALAEPSGPAVLGL